MMSSVEIIDGVKQNGAVNFDRQALESSVRRRSHGSEAERREVEARKVKVPRPRRRPVSKASDPRARDEINVQWLSECFFGINSIDPRHLSYSETETDVELMRHTSTSTSGV